MPGILLLNVWSIDLVGGASLPPAEDLWLFCISEMIMMLILGLNSQMADSSSPSMFRSTCIYYGTQIWDSYCDIITLRNDMKNCDSAFLSCTVELIICEIVLGSAYLPTLIW